MSKTLFPKQQKSIGLDNLVEERDTPNFFESKKRFQQSGTSSTTSKKGGKKPARRHRYVVDDSVQKAILDIRAPSIKRLWYRAGNLKNQTKWAKRFGKPTYAACRKELFDKIVEVIKKIAILRDYKLRLNPLMNDEEHKGMTVTATIMNKVIKDVFGVSVWGDRAKPKKKNANPETESGQGETEEGDGVEDEEEGDDEEEDTIDDQNENTTAI